MVHETRARARAVLNVGCDRETDFVHETIVAGGDVWYRRLGIALKELVCLTLGYPRLA